MDWCDKNLFSLENPKAAGIPHLIEFYNMHHHESLLSLKTGLVTSTPHSTTGWPPQTHKVWLREVWNWFWTESCPTAVDSPRSQSLLDYQTPGINSLSTWLPLVSVLLDYQSQRMHSLSTWLPLDSVLLDYQTPGINSLSSWLPVVSVLLDYQTPRMHSLSTWLPVVSVLLDYQTPMMHSLSTWLPVVSVLTDY